VFVDIFFERFVILVYLEIIFFPGLVLCLKNNLATLSQAGKSTGGSSTNDYLQDAEDKLPREDDLPSGNEVEDLADKPSELVPAKDQTWGFSRARMPPSNEGQSEEESAEGTWYIRTGVVFII
jgi:hypothetical protein